MTNATTIPLQKIRLRCNGFWPLLKPAKYATVIGKSDNAHGPRPVKRPLAKTIRIVSGPGSFNPLLISS